MTRREIKQYRKRLYREYLRTQRALMPEIVLHSTLQGDPGQCSFLDEIIVDNFPEWRRGRLTTMADFENAVAV